MEASYDTVYACVSCAHMHVVNAFVVNVSQVCAIRTVSSTHKVIALFFILHATTRSAPKMPNNRKTTTTDTVGVMTAASITTR